MQNESKGVYVQMPKPDNDEAVKLLADLIVKMEQMPIPDVCYESFSLAQQYLQKKGVLSSHRFNDVLSEATV